MDHDALPHGLPTDMTRRASDVRSTYENLTTEGLRSLGEQVSQDATYSSNESGHFAWDVSLMIRAACVAWRYSGSATHLHQAADWSQHVIERTDAARGITDWRGRRGAVWSAGSRYTAGTVRLGENTVPAVTLQAAAAAVRIERPKPGTAIVHAIRDDGTSWSSPEASLDPSSNDYLPDVLARRASAYSVRIQGLKEPIDLSFLPAGEFAVEAQRAPHLVHTGLIVRALIETADALEEAGGGHILAAVTPDELYDAGREALTHHDDQLRSGQDYQWYITPADFPGRRLAVELPHNHVADVATSFLLIGRRDEDERLWKRGASLTGPWLKEISRYQAGDLPHPWFYYPEGSDSFIGVSRDAPIAEREVPGVPRAEDSSHATMRLRALHDWHAADPELVGPEVLGVVAATLRQEFITKDRNAYSLRWLPRHADTASAGWRLGYADSYPGAWARLSPWDPSVKRIVNALASRRPPERLFGATILSAAEITAVNTRGRRAVRGPRTNRPR
ncbi:hypothetical protein [Agrococcus terreus]|uniref:Uncharacterized protein n=1 Tax=Agrococcus terreus TaxID=574649 RepID=A0ABQ2KFB1_9MICO|nr:hypothetical protein [Agrococcus terreus]GGN79912.1 hypothetical protein GCM10010968_07270 [Agrococcus terreus]